MYIINHMFPDLNQFVALRVLQCWCLTYVLNSHRMSEWFDLLEISKYHIVISNSFNRKFFLICKSTKRLLTCGIFISSINTISRFPIGGPYSSLVLFSTFASKFLWTFIEVVRDEKFMLRTSCCDASKLLKKL